MRNGCIAVLLPAILNIFLLSLAESVCTFPTELRGNWISSDKGTLNVTSDTIWRYPLPVTVSVQQVDLVCQQIDGETYMLRSKDKFLLFGYDFYAYICIELHKISAYKFWYQVANEIESSTSLRMTVFFASITPNFTTACNRAQPFAVSTFNTFVKEGALEDGLVEATCPFELLHKFSNGSLSSADYKTSCDNTTLNVCTDRTQMRITYDPTCAASLKIASEGLNICLMDRTNETSGVTYLHVWNNDTTLASGVQRINCYAFEKNGSSMIATLYPGACRESQTSDTVSSPGIHVLYHSITETCQTVVGSDPQTLYYVAVILGALGVVVLVILIVCISCKTKCRCITKLCKKTKIGHSDVSLASSVTNGIIQALRADIPRGVFVARKPIKLGPIIEPYLEPPAKVELLYEVEPRPTSSRLMFAKSVFFSEVSLRHKDIDSPSAVKIEELD